MKKYFNFVAVAAIAAFAFTGCTQPEPTEKAVLTLSQKVVEIGVDEEFRLNVTVTPAGTTANVKFTSTDPSIVTVSGSGLLTGVELGEALVIVSADNAEKNDTCKVIVSDMAVYNSYNIVDYVFLSYQGEETEMIEGTDTIIDLSIGEVVCQLGYFHFFGYDGNTSWVNGTGWAGNGFFVAYDVPVYIITDDQQGGTYNGYYINFSGIAYEALPLPEGAKPTLGIGNSGKFDIESSGNWVGALYGNDTTLDFDAIRAEMEAKNQGAFIGQVISSTNYYNYGLYAGHANKVVFQPAFTDKEGNEYQSSFAIDLDWASMQDDRIWGFLMDTAHYAATYVEGKGGEIELIKPYDYLTVHRVFDEDGWFDEDEAEEAPLRLAAKKPEVKAELGDMSKILVIDRKKMTAVRADKLLKK